MAEASRGGSEARDLASQDSVRRESRVAPALRGVAFPRVNDSIGDPQVIADAATTVGVFRIGVLLVALGAATAVDLRSRRIPNWLTLPLMAAGLFFGGLTAGPAGLARATAGLLVGAALFALPVAKLGWGMGDLKLAAAVGAMTGPQFALWTALYGFAAGGLIAALLIAGRIVRMPAVVPAGAASSRRWRTGRGATMPFAMAIALGACAALAIGPGF